MPRAEFSPCVECLTDGLSQDLLSRVEAHNVRQNPDGEKTFLLPMASAQGSPTHPAYPSGHAINLGGYITTLKVTFTVRLCCCG